MNETQTQLLVLAAVVCLPMLPAAVLFWLLPSTGEASGPLHGLQVKFGGAFAGYLVVLLCCIAIRPKDAAHFHVWSVTGTMRFTHRPDDPDPNVNDVLVRFVPPRLGLMNQGNFDWEIPVVEDGTGRLQFPDLQIDLHDYRGLTLPLGAGRYGAEDDGLQVDARARTIRILRPVVMERVGLAHPTAVAQAVPLPAAPGVPPLPAAAAMPAAVGKIQ